MGMDGYILINFVWYIAIAPLAIWLLWDLMSDSTEIQHDKEEQEYTEFIGSFLVGAPATGFFYFGFLLLRSALIDFTGLNNLTLFLLSVNDTHFTSMCSIIILLLFLLLNKSKIQNMFAEAKNTDNDKNGD